MRPNHSPFRPHRPFPFILPFFHSSRLALSNNTTDTKATTTRQPYAHFFVSFQFSLYALTSTIHSPLPARGRRYYTKLRLADMYIKRSSCSSRSIVPSIVLAQSISPSFLSLSLACLLDLAIVRWNRCPHDLGQHPPSFVLLSPSLSWFIPQSWTTLSHSQHLS